MPGCCSRLKQSRGERFGVGHPGAARLPAPLIRDTAQIPLVRRPQADEASLVEEIEQPTMKSGPGRNRRLPRSSRATKSRSFSGFRSGASSSVARRSVAISGLLPRQVGQEHRELFTRGHSQRGRGGAFRQVEGPRCLPQQTGLAERERYCPHIVVTSGGQPDPNPPQPSPAPAASPAEGPAQRTFVNDAHAAPLAAPAGTRHADRCASCRSARCASIGFRGLPDYPFFPAKLAPLRFLPRPRFMPERAR